MMLLYMSDRIFYVQLASEILQECRLDLVTPSVDTGEFYGCVVERKTFLFVVMPYGFAGILDILCAWTKSQNVATGFVIVVSQHLAARSGEPAAMGKDKFELRLVKLTIGQRECCQNEGVRPDRFAFFLPTDLGRSSLNRKRTTGWKLRPLVGMFAARRTPHCAGKIRSESIAQESSNVVVHHAVIVDATLDAIDDKLSLSLAFVAHGDKHRRAVSGLFETTDGDAPSGSLAVRINVFDLERCSIGRIGLAQISSFYRVGLGHQYATRSCRCRRSLVAPNQSVNDVRQQAHTENLPCASITTNSRVKVEIARALKAAERIVRELACEREA